jgi:hypothetical protein
MSFGFAIAVAGSQPTANAAQITTPVDNEINIEHSQSQHTPTNATQIERRTSPRSPCHAVPAVDSRRRAPFAPRCPPEARKPTSRSSSHVQQRTDRAQRARSDLRRVCRFALRATEVAHPVSPSSGSNVGESKRAPFRVRPEPEASHDDVRGSAFSSRPSRLSAYPQRPVGVHGGAHRLSEAHANEREEREQLTARISKKLHDDQLPTRNACLGSRQRQPTLSVGQGSW